MKQYIAMAGLVLGSLSAAAQKNTGSQPARYDAAIHFNSICCGPPDNSFLKPFFKQFNKANKTKLKAWLLGGCGREGEFKILLSYTGLSAKTKAKLATQLGALVTQQNGTNKAANSSSGNIELQQNPSADDLQGCRNAVTVWKY